MGSLCKPEVIVKARGEEMVDAFVVVPAELRHDIAHMVGNIEYVVATLLRLNVGVGHVVDPGG